jgi:hypothetical protein
MLKIYVCQLKFRVVVVVMVIIIIKWLLCTVDYSHLVLTLGMNGAILLLPQYAFMSWTGATLLYVHD